MQIEALILLLAQTCVAEIDIQQTPDECVVMWEVNQRTAKRRRVSLEFQTLAFNAYWDPRVRHTTRSWIGRMKADGAEPEGWPSNRSWSAERPAWLRYLTKAEYFLEGGMAVVCASADSYGGTPDDGLHADDAAPCEQAERVHCISGERQAYWDAARCRAARRKRVVPPLVSAKLAAGVSVAPARRSRSPIQSGAGKATLPPR